MQGCFGLFQVLFLQSIAMKHSIQNAKQFWAFEIEFNHKDKEMQCIDNWNDESLVGLSSITSEK
jgi:hypothetical protein